mgnify:CR=1 FL=1
MLSECRYDRVMKRFSNDRVGTQFDHIALGPWLAGRTWVESRHLALLALRRVGLEGVARQSARTLSGGQQQRVAIARALVTRPACVLADEPTGNLDRSTADGVFDLMLQLAAEQGTAFVLVTHDASLAARCHAQRRLDQGQLKDLG